MGKYDDKQPRSGRWIGFLIFLIFVNPALFVPLAIFGGIIYVVIKSASAQQSSGTKPPKQTPGRYTTRQEKFDECPQPFFCFHKDKGEHHVRRGKEIDPWDRPDIDISKYRRK